MISVEFVRTMARYSLWQNRSMLAAADMLDDAARTAGRGAFFGSIAGTLSHLLWGDLVWMSRFDGGAKPAGGIAGSAALFPEWAAFKALRRETDARVLDWATGLGEADLAGDLHWFSGALGRDVGKPMALLVVHFFNHQTHHRGQAHAMLTAAGARPEATDLFILPETIA